MYMHITDYISLRKKEDIWPTARDFAFNNVDPMENIGRRYHGDLTIFESTVCDSRREAEKLIHELTRGRSYCDYAVRYLVLPNKTKKEEDLEVQIRTLENLREGLNVKNRKSKTMTCKCCGEKIIFEKLRGNVCPKCKKDLRSDSDIKRAENLYSRITKKRQELKKETEKRKAKADEYWLLKVEVHC